MIVLVPVSRYRVPYDTARGRPYSPLEALVLQAVAEGGATLADLRRTFRVHDRLLVESVVTLVTAGWVAVAGGPQAKFVLTASGNIAARDGADPVSVVVTAGRPQTVVMERVTGQVARHAEARSWRRDDLGEEAWEQAVVMPERIIRNSLDEAQVQKLLQHETGQWIRRIGPIRILSRGAHYVAVDADPDTGLIRGLPHAWSESLSGKILECARTQALRTPRGPSTPTPQSGNGQRLPRFTGVADARPPLIRATPFELSGNDVLSGTHAHDAALSWALDNARTSVAVVAPTVDDVDQYHRIVDLAARAVARGIAVDLLVGEVAGVSASELVTITNAAGYKADAQGGRSRLRTRNPTTGSGASLLVHDAGPAPLTAVIGSHEWFALSGESLSVRVTEPSLAADAARAVASLWTGRDSASSAWAGHAERWQRLAAHAEEEGALKQAGRPIPDNPQTSLGELIVDDEHAGIIPTAAAVLVGSHRPDPGAGDAAMRGVSLRVTGAAVPLLQGMG